MNNCKSGCTDSWFLVRSTLTIDELFVWIALYDGLSSCKNAGLWDSYWMMCKWGGVCDTSGALWAVWILYGRAWIVLDLDVVVQIPATRGVAMEVCQVILRGIRCGTMLQGMRSNWVLVCVKLWPSTLRITECWDNISHSNSNKANWFTWKVGLATATTGKTTQVCS